MNNISTCTQDEGEKISPVEETVSEIKPIPTDSLESPIDQKDSELIKTKVKAKKLSKKESKESSLIKLVDEEEQSEQPKIQPTEITDVRVI